MEILTTVTVSIAYFALSCYTDLKLFVSVNFCSFFVPVEIGGDVFETSSKRGYNVGKLLVHNL